MVDNEPVRVIAEPNKKYQKSGLRSYLWLLQKYHITPTLDGPYYRYKPSQWSERHLAQDRHRCGGLKGLRRHTHIHNVRNPSENPIEEQKPPLHVATKATGASVDALEQQNDSMYLSPVTIGGQKLMLDFDTGSSDLWVMSTHLDAGSQASLKASHHEIYDPSASTTAAPASGQTWKIAYGDGSTASGDVVKDTLVIGTISVEDQAIECAKELSSAFLENAGDGLLGLGMGNINTVQPNKVHTPVENMISQGDIGKDAQLFTVYLSSWKDKDEIDEGKSFYTFGNIDHVVMQRCGAADFWWTPLVNQARGFWEFASTSWTLNGKTVARKTAQRGGNTAIADTGTTLALVDDETCRAIYKSIKGSRYDYSNQGYVFPTNTPENALPSVGFDVGGKPFYVPKEALLFAETAPGWCYGGIQSRGDLPFDIWGDTWLKGVYACFDHGNKRFGAVQRTLKTQNLSVQ